MVGGDEGEAREDAMGAVTSSGRAGEHEPGKSRRLHKGTHHHDSKQASTAEAAMVVGARALVAEAEALVAGAWVLVAEAGMLVAEAGAMAAEAEALAAEADDVVAGALMAEAVAAEAMVAEAVRVVSGLRHVRCGEEWVCKGGVVL